MELFLIYCYGIYKKVRIAKKDEKYGQFYSEIEKTNVFS